SHPASYPLDLLPAHRRYRQSARRIHPRKSAKPYKPLSIPPSLTQAVRNSSRTTIERFFAVICLRCHPERSEGSLYFVVALAFALPASVPSVQIRVMPSVLDSLYEVATLR